VSARSTEKLISQPLAPTGLTGWTAGSLADDK
jgi:hypothetical protein